MRFFFDRVFQVIGQPIKRQLFQPSYSSGYSFGRYFSYLRTPEDEEEPYDKEVESLLETDSSYEPLVPHNLRPAISTGHSLLVIQPKVKYGPNKTELYRRTTPALQLQECVALVESLPHWKAVDSILLPTKSISRQSRIIGSGQQQEIRSMINSNKSITAVMIGVDVLTGRLQSDLEDVLLVPVFDRYSMILQILRLRAKTKEARLQVSLAELLYIKSRFREAVSKEKEEVAGVKMTNMGIGRHAFHVRREMLNDRETRLKKAIEKLKESRSRKQRLKSNPIPTVGVVGYTNSGKSTLIQSLTKNPKVEAKDTLFHTLDIKVFEGRLQNMNQVLFMDTIGFIDSLPDQLIDSFKATLEQVLSVDLLIHLSDVSHPDVKNQRITVLKTLKQIGLDSKLSSTMIEAGNKIDKMDKTKKDWEEVKPKIIDEEDVEEDQGSLGGDTAIDNAMNNNSNQPKDLGPRVDLLISATKGTNIHLLQNEIERRLFVSLGCFFKRLRVSNGGRDYQWLIKNAYIVDITVDDDDQNYLFITSRMTEAVAGKFRKQFPEIPFFQNEREEETIL
jgi:GTP-binding protein HflX